MAERPSNHQRPLKPALAGTRAPRTPLTPRIAGTTTTAARPTIAKQHSTASAPPRSAPRIADPEQPREILSAGNITPRSSARKSRVDGSQTTPSHDDTPSAPRPRMAVRASTQAGEQDGAAVSPAFESAQSTVRVGRPKSLVMGNGGVRSQSPPLVRSPGLINLGDESIESRFFHASDVSKQAPAPKRAEPKKSAFFYADGKKEEAKKASPAARSPMLSAVSDKQSPAPWMRSDGAVRHSKSPPMLSPALSSLTGTSPYFAAATGQPLPRSPSPSKENIHLSYRKGASQIFGTRQTPRPSPEAIKEERRVSSEFPSAASAHRKSPSLSSIDSGNTPGSRRRSSTQIEATPSPLHHEIKSATLPRSGRMQHDTPSIETSKEPPTPDVRSGPESAFSPTRAVAELAADARRERKVLDLEISNSSLLAINASLEREVRRQKAELKRFRRLSRAGRFSINPNERAARFSEGLSTLGEDDEDAEYAEFGLASGFSDVYGDFSDDETESILSGGDSVSPGSQAFPEAQRLARDEKRLQVDLSKHKELLVQSQMMNQSIKRCMFATEDMIKDGKKALEYHVKVSDVKIGGRVLSSHDDDEEGHEEIEVEDDTLHGDDAAEDFLKVWQGVGRPSIESSEGTDRDSGIEADRPPPRSDAGGLDSGRPPDG